MPRLIQTTITITMADLRAMDQARDGVETPGLADLHNRVKAAMDQAKRTHKAQNEQLRFLKKKAGLTK